MSQLNWSDSLSLKERNLHPHCSCSPSSSLCKPLALALVTSFPWQEPACFSVTCFSVPFEPVEQRSYLGILHVTSETSCVCGYLSLSPRSFLEPI